MRTTRPTPTRSPPARSGPEGRGAAREGGLDEVRPRIDPDIAAGHAVIDDIIDPRDTRPTIISALRRAKNKQVDKPRKRHGVMPV